MDKKETYWDDKYRTGNTGWNIGYVSTPLKAYIDQLTIKDRPILLPGGGNSYEAEYLFRNGFSQVYVADISIYPLQNLLQRVPEFPKKHLLHTDFFELQGSFDLILEQTFFCAISPDQRDHYVQKAYDLLDSYGRLVGLLFDFPLTDQGPPYGGDKSSYQHLFSKKFDIEIMERAYNSIPPRRGRELFFKLQRK